MKDILNNILYFISFMFRYWFIKNKIEQQKQLDEMKVHQDLMNSGVIYDTCRLCSSESDHSKNFLESIEHFKDKYKGSKIVLDETYEFYRSDCDDWVTFVSVYVTPKEHLREEKLKRILYD